MTIYIDITQFERGRANTGVQRVLKNFMSKAFDTYCDIEYKILIYDSSTKKMQLLPLDDVKLFLDDIEGFEFKSKTSIDIEHIKPKDTTLFFDIDAAWNAPYKREVLYPILKNNGFMICNFIYDLIPILLPEFVHNLTIKNFQTFISTLYSYSDMIFFDSNSAQKDFFRLKKLSNKDRYIASRVVGLGSDFSNIKETNKNKEITPILKTKYILFVGTIEPRKNQQELLTAFDSLSDTYPDLNLVFVGKKGWKVDALISKIQSHPLKEKRIFWLNNIDDNALATLYKNAFLVTYLSKYEGYGLPITESLSYGKITIASKNSSMYEAGKDYADYIEYGSKNELKEIISLYLDNKPLRLAKQEYIKANFTPITWSLFADSIFTVIKNIDASIKLRQNHLKKLQFVFISIDTENLRGTIAQIDKHIDFVKEYIIITTAKQQKEFQKIQTKNKLIVIDEAITLDAYKQDFHKKDHQSKNWLLRASLLNLDILDDEFIMLDDDNKPLKNIPIQKFITKEGRYNAYYFYDLLDWHHKSTDYDVGQQNTKEILSEKNYELLSYSSHAPQIINKKIFKEAVDMFFDIGLEKPIDEWSIYFNYAVSNYPLLFDKKLFETLNWPESPLYWDSKFNKENISFENYYKSIYDSRFFTYKDSYEQKLKKKQKQIAPFEKTKEIFNKNRDIYANNNLVHGILEFKNQDIELYLSNIPYYVIVEKEGSLRLRLNYKLLNLKNKNLDISIVVFCDQKVSIVKTLSHIDTSFYQESIVEVPITTHRLKTGIYDITINLNVDDTYIYPQSSPYLIKLIVSKDKDYLSVLKNPKIIERKIMQKNNLKQKIKDIPFIGWFVRWGYNLLRLNNLKHKVHHQQQQINKLQHKLQHKLHHQQQQLNQQQQQLNHLKNTIDKHIESQVAKQVSVQSDSLQQQMDQFILDTSIDKNIDAK